MTSIKSDRELLDRLGFTEADAADYLDRTRQTINAALGASSGKRSGYFKPSDILVLRLAARGAGHQVNDEAVIQYVEDVHGAESAARVKNAFGVLGGMPNLTGCDEVWILLPDFTDLRRTDSQQADALRRLAWEHPDTEFVFFCGSPFQTKALESFVRGSSPPDASPHMSFLFESVIGAQPMMLITDPAGSDPHVHVLTPAGFTRACQVKGSLIGAYLASVASQLHELPSLEERRKRRGLPRRA